MGTYDQWKTRAPEDEPGYWSGQESPEDDDDRYEYETAVMEIAMGIRAADDGASDIRRNARYASDEDKAYVQHVAAKWAQLAQDLTERT